MIKRQKKLLNNTMLGKFYRGVLRKKTPLFGFTILQLSILFIVINVGVASAALLVYKPSTNASMEAASTSENMSRTQSSSQANSNTPNQETSTQPTNATQSTNSPKSNTSSDSGSTLDQYGCATNTSSYNQCVQNKKQLWCNSQVSEPASAFSSATTQARAAYNSVMNEWESAQYTTPHSPKSEYEADATSKFNAIYEPAYSTYYSKVQSLNSQGCSLQYSAHESAGQYW